MTGIFASVRVLFAKNWRVKQRESRLNKNRPTTPNAWLFPPMLTDIVLPLVIILYIIQQFCNINEAIVEALPGVELDATRQLARGTTPHKLHVVTASAVTTLTALPLILTRSNMTLLTLDRLENHAFLAYLDRVYPGDDAIGLQPFSKLTKFIPETAAHDGDAVLRDYPLVHGIRAYLGFDLRRVTPLAAKDWRVFLYEQDDPMARLLTNQVAKYFSVNVHQTAGDSDSRTFQAPGILPWQMAMSVYLRTAGQAVETPEVLTGGRLSPADACDLVNAMLDAVGLTWRDLPDDSPIRGSVTKCRQAIQHGRVSAKTLAFLKHYAALTTSNDTMEKLEVDVLPKRPQITVSGQLDTSIILYLAYLFVWPYSRLIRDIVQEKEKQLKEYLLIMGLQPMVLLVSWFLVYFVASIVVVVVACAMLSDHMFKGDVASEAHFAMLLLIFATSMLLFGVAITPIFNQARTAAAVAPLLYMALGISTFLRSWLGEDAVDESLLKYVVWFMEQASSPVVFIETIKQILARDALTGQIRVIEWATVAQPSLKMLIQCVEYLVLGWYLESVCPRTFGVQRPWYFVFQPSYWFPGHFKPSRSEYTSDDDTELARLTDVEGHTEFPDDDTIREQSMADYLHHFRPILLVKALAKRYPNGKLAVQNVSFGVKKGEIFGLLGPNGAGKSTTMSILCGMLSPTAGDAFVGNSSVVADPQAIRKSLSVCFQQNILFDELTVWEHLKLVYNLKTALGIKAVDEELWTHKLKHFGLEEKMDALSKTLSGGQKRKLSLILALMDTSRVVLLDEPTAGMDLKARVDTWDALKKAVSHRAVILTTHSMQEAQALCENIGIVADGKLKCCGSSLFLRERFGVGYKLTVVHQDVNNSKLTGNRVLNIVTKHVASAELVSENKWETRVQLNSDDPATLIPIFEDLERLKLEGKIQRYAVAATDLEDVFVQVTDGGDVYHHAKDDEAGSDKAKTNHAKFLSSSTSEQARTRLSDAAAMPLQLHALLLKRLRLMIRNKRSFWSQYVWPLVFFAILLALNAGISGGGDDFEVMTALPPSASHTNFFLGALAEAKAAAQQLMENLDTDAKKRVYLQEVESADDMLDWVMHRNSSTSFFGAAMLKNATEFTVFYNESIARSLPVTLSWFSTAYCKSLHHQDPSECDLSITKSAFPRPTILHSKLGGEDNSVQVDPSEDSSIRFVVAAYLLLTVGSISANYITAVVRERENGLQRLQFLHLASKHASFVFWVSHLVFDYLSFLASILVLVVIIYMFGVAWQASSMVVLVVISAVYGLSSLAFSYLVSLAFSSHSSAQSVMSFVMSFQVLGSWVAFALSMIPSLCVKIHTIATYLRVLPLFAYSEALLNLATPEMAPIRDQCLKPSDNPGADIGTMMLSSLGGLSGLMFEPVSPWAWSPTGRALVYLGVTFTVYMLLVLWMDSMQIYPTLLKNRIDRLLRRATSTRPPSPHGSDKNIIQVRGLTKVYNPKKATASTDASESPQHEQEEVERRVLTADGQVVAVNNISFLVERNDCVALLGVNGSGKSTTFEVLTSGIAPTQGSAFIDRIDVTREPQRASRSYGYCPQTNIQFAELSVREHLQLFYRLRTRSAYTSADESRAIDALMTRLDLHQVSSTQAGHLSGGNKRRLMLALSLLNDDVALLLMDEPSAGVDVVARRLMWRVLHDKRRQSQRELSCLFTTHSMEEAEAVCANAVVLNKGHVVWNGSIPALKHHASRGISLSLRLDTAQAWESERVRYFVEKIRATLNVREAIPVDQLQEAWRVCRDNNMRTKNQVPTNSEQQWITALVARVQQDPSAASIDGETTAAMEITVFVKEWLLKEAFATIETQLFQDVISARSGEPVKPVELQNYLGSGSSSTAVYETNCSDSFSLLDAFKTMEQHKARFAVARYSISELSLERVFEQFT